jgi:hypothetical protein
MILLCGFINKSKHIKTATVTPTKFTHDQKRKRKENFKFTTHYSKFFFFFVNCTIKIFISELYHFVKYSYQNL